MKLTDLTVYREAQIIGEQVWEIVSMWPHLARQSIGLQWIRAADSVSANISEGFGRFHYKENKQFCYYARGSLYETLTWLQKAHKRRLVSDITYKALHQRLTRTLYMLNRYIKSIGPGINHQ